MGHAAFVLVPTKRSPRARGKSAGGEFECAHCIGHVDKRYRFCNCGVAVGFGEVAVCLGESDIMRTLTVAVWLGLAAMIGVQGASAQTLSTTTTLLKMKPAPAPMFGGGVPAVLLIGGVLLGAKILRRRRLDADQSPSLQGTPQNITVLAALHRLQLIIELRPPGTGVVVGDVRFRTASRRALTVLLSCGQRMLREERPRVNRFTAGAKANVNLLLCSHLRPLRAHC